MAGVGQWLSWTFLGASCKCGFLLHKSGYICTNFFLRGKIELVLWLWMLTAVTHPFLMASVLTGCKNCFITGPECLKLLQLAHPSWFVSFFHKVKAWLTPFLQASVCTTLWKGVLMGIYEWASKCTFCKLSFLCKVKWK
jgi:hypothetical protein